MTKARPSAAWPQPLYNWHLFCKNTRMLNNWQQKHLDHVSLYFSTRILTNEHQTLQFFIRKVWLFQLLTKEIKAPFQNQIWTVLEGDTNKSDTGQHSQFLRCFCNRHIDILIRITIIIMVNLLILIKVTLLIITNTGVVLTRRWYVLGPYLETCLGRN